jgi:glutamate formiminotransferase/formiminotetrahydrofolate cyclodeaminase
MVARLTVGKEKYRDEWEGMERLRDEADALRIRFLDLLSQDANSFNAFMEAMKLPKDTEDQKAKRSKAMQEALLHAARIPLETVRALGEMARLAREAVARGNRNAVTDAGTAALLARAAALAAAYNVRANLLALKDQDVVARLRRELEEALAVTLATADEVLPLVEEKLV